MAKRKKEYGNCPYCSSPNCNLSMSDFFGKKTKKELKNPFESLGENPMFKAHLERLEKERSLGISKK